MAAVPVEFEQVAGSPVVLEVKLPNGKKYRVRQALVTMEVQYDADAPMTVLDENGHPLPGFQIRINIVHETKEAT